MSNERQRPEGNPRSAGINTDIKVRPRNWLVPLGLAMLRQWNSHGYELMDRYVELGFESINPGTVYRTLRKMENEGFCESKWETASSSGGPARRMYSITDAGEAYLDLWAKSLEHYQQTMDAFLQTYKSGGSRS
jgi:PadR family transcriptional regulator, regulatory protein PadR